MAIDNWLRVRRPQLWGTSNPSLDIHAMADAVAGACKEFLNGLPPLPFDLAPSLERRIKNSELGCADDLQVVQDKAGLYRVTAEKDLNLKHVWVIPHILSTPRSKLYKTLKSNPPILQQCVELMRLASQADVDEVFEVFWSWCAPDAISSDEERLLETHWHLLPKNVSWIPHADDGNVAVCPLPRKITTLLELESAGWGASMMFILTPLKAGQPLKRDHLPVRRSLQRVARLITLIGDNRLRWAHPTERDGLQQVFQSAAPNPPPPWDLVRELGDKGDGRPRMAMTEFSPDVFSVFTDYPGVKETLTDERFAIVESFNNCHILFAASPVSGFFDLAQRMVNQFPHEHCLLNPRFFMHTVRLLAQSAHGGRVTDLNQQAQSLPSWFPLMFDLKTEVNHLLAEYNQRDQNGKDNFWIIYSGEFGNENWCFTNNKCTIVKHAEVNNGNWVVRKAVHPPVQINGRKIILSVFALVVSFDPLEAYMYNKFHGRVARNQYTTAASSVHDADVHMPLEALGGDIVSHDDLKDGLSKCGIQFEELECKLLQALHELLSAAKMQVGEWPRSRALYRVDCVVPLPTCGEEVDPKILSVSFAPDLSHVIHSNPNFVNEVFSVLFTDSAIPTTISKLESKA